MDDLVEAIRQSLLAIRNPRFYRTERGFQGEFGAELRNRLSCLALEGAVLEHEYQKRLDEHGLKIRPDLIIHIPFEGSDYIDRTEGNFAVIELKHRANIAAAQNDYQNLTNICIALNYPQAVFINIDSNETYIEHCTAPKQVRVNAFAVSLVDGNTQLIESERT